VAARLSNRWVFRREFAALFGPAHPLSEAEAADQWSLLTRDGGHLLGHRLVHYLDERVRYAQRWHGAVRDWAGSLAFAWGLRDPVATVAVLEAVLELRPDAPTDRFGELGHYPQIEDPVAIAASVRAAVDRSQEAA
jgi:pimeloyl-ACP methyl ester carboxylesterase